MLFNNSRGAFIKQRVSCHVCSVITGVRNRLASGLCYFQGFYSSVTNSMLYIDDIDCLSIKGNAISYSKACIKSLFDTENSKLIL